MQACPVSSARFTVSTAYISHRDVPAIWSSEHALSWHFGEDFRRDSAAWATTKCLNWVALESKLPNFLVELVDCPCTLAQARADTGRYFVSAG